jgi:hypothetical protein
MPDQYYEDALEHIEALLSKIEGVALPGPSKDFPGASDDLHEYLASVAQKLVTLRDRMTGEEGNYTVGGS